MYGANSQNTFIFYLFFLYTIFINVLLLYPEKHAISEYPVITTLQNKDILYKQLQEDIHTYYKAVHSHGKIPFPSLKIFQYTPPGDSDMFEICSRLNVPYDTIATINHISNPVFFHSSPFILIPNIPGIFIPEYPVSDLEQILYSWRMYSQRMQSEKEPEIITVRKKGNKEKFLFFPGERFHPVERA